MKTILNQLDKHLQEKRPKYYKTLQAPLSEQDIAQLEEKHAITLPFDLKILFLWKNGQRQDSYEAFVNNSIFEPLEQVLQGNKEFTQMIGYDFEIENWWNENWLPIFSNGSGNYICYDIKGVFTGEKGQLIEYWNTDNDRPVIATNLTDFLNELNQYYEKTATKDFDDYFDISECITQWQKVFIVDKPIKK